MNYKRVLIISPHFPPVNTPDLHRIRMSLPYYRDMGWEPVVLCVDPRYVEGFQDDLLSETIPTDVEVHYVKAWSPRFTRKLGIGSLSIRSFFFFLKAGNQLLKQQSFDLVFFSTTAFHVCALGRYWKQKFNIPFVIDLQDPWRNDYYLSKPKAQRPPKFWLAYTLDKWLEAYTLPYASGLMTVSPAYITMIKTRYPQLVNLPARVIPFGASMLDFKLVQNQGIQPPSFLSSDPQQIKVVYVGAVTPFFMPLIRAFFQAFRAYMGTPIRHHFYFIGTNYSAGVTRKPLEALATEFGLAGVVTEIPERIPYFSALATLMAADVLFVPGSMDIDYNASKIYNNILSGTPIFSIFHQNSLVKQIIEACHAGLVVGVSGQETPEALEQLILAQMDQFNQLHQSASFPELDPMTPFLAPEKTREQLTFFEEVLSSEYNTQTTP